VGGSRTRRRSSTSGASRAASGPGDLLFQVVESRGSDHRMSRHQCAAGSRAHRTPRAAVPAAIAQVTYALMPARSGGTRLVADRRPATPPRMSPVEEQPGGAVRGRTARRDLGERRGPGGPTGPAGTAVPGRVEPLRANSSSSRAYRGHAELVDQYLDRLPQALTGKPHPHVALRRSKTPRAAPHIPVRRRQCAHRAPSTSDMRAGTIAAWPAAIEAGGFECSRRRCGS